MAITIHDMLQPQVVLDVVSRIRRRSGRLSRFFGFNNNRFDMESGTLSGPNTTTSPTRSGTYRIYDVTRTAAQARAPGTGPALIAPNPIGEVAYTAIRWHEKIRLQYEELGNLTTTVGPNTVIDAGGQDYITRQLGTLVQRMNNAQELSVYGMVRGFLFLKPVGETWIPVLTDPGAATGRVVVNFQAPAGNLNQLNMLGGGNLLDVAWSDTANAKIVTQLLKVRAAYVQLTGWDMKHIWVDGPTWALVINNTEVRNLSGSANTAYLTYTEERERGLDGEETASSTATLRGMPWLVWHVIDDVLVADGGGDPSYASGTGTLTKAIPSGMALITPDPDKEWCDWINCGEYVVEGPNMPAVRREGMFFWKEYSSQPSTIEIIGLFNGLPRVRVPRALVLATVTGF